MPMKKLVLCGAMLLLIGGFEVACQAQSKEETLQWIKQRLPNAKAVKYENQMSETPNRILAYQDVVANGCSLTFVEKLTAKYESVDGSSPDLDVFETVVTVPLGRLSKVDSVTGSDYEWDNGNSVELKAYDKIITWKSTEQQSSKSGGLLNTKSQSGTTSEHDIVTNDSDLAQRLAKALAHANELCGAKKEAF